MKSKLYDGHFGHIGITQRAVIDDILVHGLSEHETLEKHKVSPSRYRRWLENGVFRRELDARLESASRQTKFTTVHSLPHAIKRLAELTKSEKDETARKACLDIIALQKADIAEAAARKAEQDQQEDASFKMSDSQAAKIWAILAEPDTEPRASATGSASDDGWRSQQVDDVMGGMAITLSDSERGDHVNATAQIPAGADPSVCPPASASDNWPSPNSTMSYGEWIEKYGLPQPDGWQPPKEPALSDSEWVDGACVAKNDTNSEQSPDGHVKTIAPNPDREAGIKNHRDAALSIERATERRRLLARPARGMDLSSQNQKKTFIRRY